MSVTWTRRSRVNSVDPAMLALMKRPGRDPASFGPESDSQENLDRPGKGTAVEQAMQAVEMATAA
jgi:radical SAM superfamily enzyme YgiQ (UPF0313 family)